MSENIQICVVIPTYNRGHIVGRAIESAIAQEYPPTEIIVIDDGSVDSTRETLESYGDQIRWVYQANAGVSSARNRGVKETKSEWIAFLDSDDYWYPEHLERIVSAIHGTGGEAALYFSNLNVPGQEGDQYWSRCGFQINGKWELKRDAGDWAFLRIQPMMVQASVVSRKAFVELGGFSEQLRTCEDTLLFFKLCLLYPVCAVSGCGTVLNSDGNLRLTDEYHKSSTGLSQARIFLYKELLSRMKDIKRERREILRDTLAASYFGSGRAFFRQRKLLSVINNFALSCRVNPLVFMKELSGSLGRYLTKKLGYKRI